MTDRELLEAAAKAAGLWDAANNCIDIPWNPLNDDGDALRLAVGLQLHINIESYGSSARRKGKDWHGCEAHLHGGLAAATRRAITRAAAALAVSDLAKMEGAK